MAGIDRMDRTWLCSVLFMDIVGYSSQSVELQMKWKRRFNGYLAEAIAEVPESERVILDTGDGAAVCFLGAPETPMFAALQLCSSFCADEREQPPGLRVRIGINLGPVKLIKDINGALNAIGDGINAGQRIMSFAAANQILVSQSFYEVVSRLSDEYKQMFQLKGVEKDKHVREHTVYHLTPPGSERREAAVDPEPKIVMGVAPADVPLAGTPALAVPAPSRNRSTMWLAIGAALVVVAGLGAWYIRGSKATRPDAPVASQSAPANAPVATAAPTPAPATAAQLPQPAATAPVETARLEKTPPSVPVTNQAASPSAPLSSSPPSADATAAFEGGMRLLQQGSPTEALEKFSNAIRIKPDYVAAYVGRAQARRQLMQYDLSIADCNNVIRISPSDARGPNCRGSAYLLMKQYEPAERDFNDAIRLKPDFELAFLFRGTAYSGMQQYDRAIQDFSAALRLQPRNILTLRRRGAAYIGLNQYDKAIADYTQALRVDPDDVVSYAGRAKAEQLAGDTAGAAADRRQAQRLRKAKKGGKEEE